LTPSVVQSNHPKVADSRSAPLVVKTACAPFTSAKAVLGACIDAATSRGSLNDVVAERTVTGGSTAGWPSTSPYQALHVMTLVVGGTRETGATVRSGGTDVWSSVKPSNVRLSSRASASSVGKPLLIAIQRVPSGASHDIWRLSSP